MTRMGLDTMLLVYAEGADGESNRLKATNLIASLASQPLILPTQVLGELYNVLTRKRGVSREEARARALAWTSCFETAAASSDVFGLALDLAAAHQLQFWDALILATAADAGCRILLTEDMADGFVWRGCTVANPFAEQLHPLLEDLLAPR